MSQNQLSSSRPTNLLLHLFSFPQRLAPTACKATQARSVGTNGTSPLQCPLPSSVFLQWQVVLLPCWFPNLLQERQIPYYSTSCLHYHLDSFHPFQDDCPGHFPYDQSSANPIQTFCPAARVSFPKWKLIILLSCDFSFCNLPIFSI